VERALASPTSHHISLNGLVTQIALQATIPGRACDCLQPHQHTHTCSVKDERKEHAQVAMQAPQFGKRMCLRTHTHTHTHTHALAKIKGKSMHRLHCRPHSLGSACACAHTHTHALAKIKGKSMHRLHCRPHSLGSATACLQLWQHSQML